MLPDVCMNARWPFGKGPLAPNTSTQPGASTTSHSYSATRATPPPPVPSSNAPSPSATASSAPTTPTPSRPGAPWRSWRGRGRDRTRTDTDDPNGSPCPLSLLYQHRLSHGKTIKISMAEVDSGLGWGTATAVGAFYMAYWGMRSRRDRNSNAGQQNIAERRGRVPHRDA